MRVRDALAQATASLAHSPTPRLDAELLLAEVLGRSRAWLIAHGDDPLPPEALARYRAWVKRRARGEPVAYILGYTWFYGLKLHVTPDVLIPRPETELLVALALKDLQRRPEPQLHVVDVGTGSGAIAVVLAAREPRAHVLATDISAAALRVAALNARTHNVAARVHFLQTDLLAAATGPFHLIAANLPYVGEDDADVLAPEVREYEPAVALWAGKDGLALIRKLLAQAPTRLAGDGVLLLEVGFRQARTVERLARAHFPNAHITRHRDLAGHERVVRVAREGQGANSARATSLPSAAR